ncbi:MAG: hypothetical protein SV377_06010 [Halobacteria archaeon]|nr:hypothetical protein [Halobacteria archaeon]
MYGVDLGNLFEDHRLNARLSWSLIVFLVVISVVEFLIGEWIRGLVVGLVTLLAVLPGPFYRTHEVTLPWEIIAVVAIVLTWLSLTPDAVVPIYLTIAAVALIIAVELHIFTKVRMTHRFAVAFVVIATSATAGIWAVFRWLSDVYLGTSFIPTHNALMWEFVYATLAGIGAGVFFDLYVRWWEAKIDRLTPLIEEHQV